MIFSLCAILYRSFILIPIRGFLSYVLVPLLATAYLTESHCLYTTYSLDKYSPDFNLKVDL
jgi:hypothetical protein